MEKTVPDIFGVSIGIACSPMHGNNLEQLLEALDNAMYEVKKQGRNDYRMFVAKDDSV